MNEWSADKTDAEILEALRASAKLERDFLCRPGKQARELWVVKNFLANLPITFDERELEALPENNKVDVRFRDAGFQVKEIVTEGLSRCDEAKAHYEHLLAARTLREITSPSSPYDTPIPARSYSLISERAQTLGTKKAYAGMKSKLDLLFYITRTNTSHIHPSEIDAVSLGSIGWRSISCLIGNRSTVLFCQTNAPAFLGHCN